MNTVYKYQTMIGNTTIAENRDEGSFIWENSYDEETGINTYELALFIPREDGLYEKDEEVHYQRAYPWRKSRNLLEKRGWSFWQCMMRIHWNRRRKIVAGLPL